MTWKQKCAHGMVLAGGIFLLLGFPLFKWNIRQQGMPEAVSSASVIVDKPSGDYIVYICRNVHTNQKNLKEWKQFFQEGDFSYLFEDIVCSVADSDTGAAELAKSFQSRLPANQMRIESTDKTLLLSRMEHQKFDVIIMSRESAESAGVLENSEKEEAEVIYVRSEK